MDCRTALEILDAVRPDFADRMEPEVSAASDHIESCRRCEDHFLARRHFDRRLGQVMRDVPVPAGLKSRLLAEVATPRACEEQDATTEQPAALAGAVAVTPDAPLASPMPDPPGRRQQRGRRRALLLALASTALLLLAAVTFFLARASQAPAWTMAELRHDAGTAFQDFDDLPVFDGGFDPRLPEYGWETSRAIAIARQPRGFPPGTGPHAAALYYFALRDGRPGRVDGILLVTPKQNIAEPPANQRFNAQGVGSGPVSTVAWTEGEYVYVCVVRGGGDSLERVERALRLTQAA